MKWIWFDMDGTFVDLYGVKDWLDGIESGSSEPYAQAKPLFNMNSFARALNHLQEEGYKIGIVSWTAKGASQPYKDEIRKAKLRWLRHHLASVNFDSIDIIGYGEFKESGRDGILFDDEVNNRKYWNGQAYDVQDILNKLRELY